MYSKWICSAEWTAAIINRKRKTNESANFAPSPRDRSTDKVKLTNQETRRGDIKIQAWYILRERIPRNMRIINGEGCSADLRAFDPEESSRRENSLERLPPALQSVRDTRRYRRLSVRRVIVLRDTHREATCAATHPTDSRRPNDSAVALWRTALRLCFHPRAVADFAASLTALAYTNFTQP